MNTLTTKLRIPAIGTMLLACATTLPICAQEAAPSGAASTTAASTTAASKTAASRQAPSKQENIGVVSGLAIGALAAGPFGAVAGAAAGAWLGDRYHRQSNERAALASNLSSSESERTQLGRNIADLNESLAKQRQRTEQLDLALSHADEIETDVSFRTNDDAVQVRAMSPLLKLGALAATMPDVKVHVEGYADSRGPDAINDALSARRAENVAAVLTGAGLPADRLIVEAHGKSAATATEGDLDGYALDRRVTVRIESAQAHPVARND